MCEICNKKECCCEKRISVVGKKADQGIPGKSSYIYMAYADDVTPGTPDVVIGFSTTVSKCWVAVITSLIPLTPVVANFQGQWFNRCVSPCTCDVTGNGASAAIDQSIDSLTYVVVTGSATPVLDAGTYLFWGELNVGLLDNTEAEYTFYDGAAVGVSRIVGQVATAQTNQEGQVFSICEKLILAAPTAISLAMKTSGIVTIVKRSVQYIKVNP